VQNDLICGLAAHIDFGSAIDTGGGLRLSAAYQADDSFGQAEHRRLAQVLASMHRSSATASATVEALGSDPKRPGSEASWAFQPCFHGPHGGGDHGVTALEQLLDAAFDEAGDERLDPGERIVSVSRKGLDPIVGEEAFDERVGAPDVGPGEIDLACQTPGVVCWPRQGGGVSGFVAGKATVWNWALGPSPTPLQAATARQRIRRSPKPGSWAGCRIRA